MATATECHPDSNTATMPTLWKARRTSRTPTKTACHFSSFAGLDHNEVSLDPFSSSHSLLVHSLC